MGRGTSSDLSVWSGIDQHPEPPSNTMSYDLHDEARDAMYDEISRELYADHKAQAITEFTTSRLQSY